MEVFGIGPLEIALVVIIAFIVLGPDRIPGVMRQLGTWARQLREFTNNITRDYGSDIQQLTGEVNALQEELRSIQRELTGVATGFMSTTFSATVPPTRSQPAAPVEPIEPPPPDAANSIDQSLIDDVRRANTPPAPPAASEPEPDGTFEI